MSRYRKAKERSGKRAPPKARGGASQEGAAGRGKGRGGLRDKTGILIAAGILILVVVFGFLKFYGPHQPDQQSAPPTLAGSATGPRAAIVDQLSLTQPNPAFVETATNLLEEAGYTVDYYPGEQVTVDFYRDLPTRGYEFLILRVHSALTGTGEEATDDATLYTTEPYSESKYLSEQVARRLGIASYYEGGPEYFGITPEFVRSSMKGEFDQTVVILMGCDGLRSDAAAEAFVRRGARAFVSWSGPVSASHTDAATERLLQHLLVDRLTLGQAVAQTMAEVGPDPTYGSSLSFYPPESAASGLGEAYLAH